MAKTLTWPQGCEWMKDAARNVEAEQAIVEVGVYQGGSLRYLMDGSLEGNGAPVFGVDPWNGTRKYGPENQAIAAEHVPEATLIKGKSVDVAADWTGPRVGLLFIDGNHTEQDVLADFYAWRRHMAPYAIVCFDDHDERFPGILQAVHMLAERKHITKPIQISERTAASVALQLQ